jgi:hypothetical protein
METFCSFEEPPPFLGILRELNLGNILVGRAASSMEPSRLQLLSDHEPSLAFMLFLLDQIGARSVC